MLWRAPPPACGRRESECWERFLLALSGHRLLHCAYPLMPKADIPTRQISIKGYKSWKVLLNRRVLRFVIMHSRPNYAPAVKCARCGKPLTAPDSSEYVDEYRVRHFWKCDPCNYSFEAIIASRPAKKRDDSVSPSVG